MNTRPTPQKLVKRMALNLVAIAAVCVIFGAKAHESDLHRLATAVPTSSPITALNTH